MTGWAPRKALGGRRLLRASRSAVDLVAGRPALGLYLAAVALLPWTRLGPFDWLHEHAQASDALIAAALVAALWERVSERRPIRLRVTHVAMAAYLVTGAVSALFATGERSDSALILLGMGGLVALAVLTAYFARERECRNAIVLVVVATSLTVALSAAVGLLLFYLGVETSLLGSYGALTGSARYARVQAGFYSPALLGSFCIFASAVAAREDSDVPPSVRRLTQTALAFVVVVTFSRAIIGFAVAAAIRFGYSRARPVVGVLATLAGVLVMVALTVGTLQVEPSRPLATTYEVPGPELRWPAFRSSFETLGNHPIVGYGPASLPGRVGGDRLEAHMTALGVAATMGLPALAVLTALIAVLWRRRARPTDIATWSGLAGLGVDSLGQDVERFRHVWMLLGFADASREEETDEDGGGRRVQ